MSDNVGAVWTAIAVVAAIVGRSRITAPDDLPQRRPVPVVSYAPAVTFTMIDSACADGWRSPSIGRRGACSWHGGVVYHYRGSDGTELRCRTGTYPPHTAEEQRRQRAASGSLYCR